jgi:hypothetical protein
MFDWYRNSAKCYVYLSDVSTSQRLVNGKPDRLVWEKAFQESLWFTRGWTLQELVAPTSVTFFSAEEECIGSKITLEQCIGKICDIKLSALRGAALSTFSVDERFSWARSRQTKEPEDKAHCLLGLFNVHMPLIYGEGEEKALKRLREEIEKTLEVPLQRSIDRTQVGKCVFNNRGEVKNQVGVQHITGGLTFQ